MQRVQRVLLDRRAKPDQRVLLDRRVKPDQQAQRVKPVLLVKQA